MTFAAVSAQTSKIQVEIASTFTDFPGVQNFTPDPGENQTFDAGDITSTYDCLMPADVGGGGSVSGTALLDVLDPVHQYLQAVHNNRGVPPSLTSGYVGVPGKAFVSATGVIWDFDGILTKWTPKAERKNGWMVDFNFDLAVQMLMNTADP